MQLLVCISVLNLRNSFASYNKEQLINLAKFYLKGFLSIDLTDLSFQLDKFIIDIRSDGGY